MKRYIGTKIIHAEPCDAWKKAGDHDIGASGYRVEYKDGYISWSPKKEFEGAYTELNGMSFGLALELMKKGGAVKLPHWSNDVYIKCHFPNEKSKMTAPYLYVTSQYGMVPWKETMIELFSNDWQEVIINIEKQ